MATIIPSRLAATASQGERNVHQLLARLPKNCVVYFEPNINGRHLDFVVIIPRLGVLVIAVKGWYAQHCPRRVIRQLDGGADDLDVIQSVRVNMTHCERSTGASPTLIECSSREDELLEVERLIGQLLDGTWGGRRVGKLAAHEIAILNPGRRGKA